MGKDVMRKDYRWLAPWIPEIRRTCGGRPILELGAGWGLDTRYLQAKGISTVGLDLAREAFTKHGADILDRRLVQADMGQGLPFREGAFSFVLASLCLHYFDWDHTVSLVDEIGSVLCAEGFLLARLNSTKDVNYGAGSGQRLGRNYYRVGRKCKRFFDEADVRRLFQDWRIAHLEEKVIDRYDKPKVVWELSAYPMRVVRSNDKIL
jgi:SAM-dependent methyltransferase